VSRLIILAILFLTLVLPITSPPQIIIINRWPPEGCQDLGTDGDCSGDCCWFTSQLYCEVGMYCDISGRSCEYVTEDGTSFRWEREGRSDCY
jgi:hypothetical protein